MVGVGIDIVEVSEVEEALREHADRYLDRVFTPAEQRAAQLPDGTPDVRHLAAIFAAKEAAFKALLPGEEPIPWLTIELAPSSRALVLSGAAAAAARRRGITALHLDLTRCGSYAAAVLGDHDGA